MTSQPAGDPAEASAPLVVRTVEIAPDAPLLSLLPETSPLAWVRHGDGIVGWGQAARLDVRGPERTYHVG